MSPTSNNNITSPAKRPGLARRSVSSHAIITTRTSPANATEAAAPAGHKARTHVVGGSGHRGHGRNASFGKNLNKLQRLQNAQNMQLFADTSAIGTGARHHQRKKSAPVTPAESPRVSGSHIRWDSANTSLGEHKSHASMRKNYSTPALHRNTSTATIPKKSLVTDRPPSAKGNPKKSVGFELVGDSDSEEEWEDSTQSPESTRRGSAVHSAKDSAESSQVLVDPLTFVKRQYPQIPQSKSLPESTFSNPTPGIEDSDDEVSDHQKPASISSNDQQPEQREPRPQEPEDIANRLLSQSRVSKAPPAMSSISATGTATAVDTARRNESLTNLASSHGGSRHPTPALVSQATSSSIEGGVSHFIVNSQSGVEATSQRDSDPTPSSFLPHYHPQSLPSPERTSVKKATATSPPPRPLRDGPPSRTQQKLWLQRTAALTTSTPDSHGSSALPQSTIDPVFIAASHSRNEQYDNSRGSVNGGVRVGTTHESEAKHTRKVYEKTSLELHVVRRFQSPAKNSFIRLQTLENATGRLSTSSEGKNSKPASLLATGQFLQTPPSRRARAALEDDGGMAVESSHDRQRTSKPSRVYFQDHDDLVNVGDPFSESADRLAVEPQSDNHTSSHTSRSGGTSISADEGAAVNRDHDGYFATEQEMLLRRMWESRGEVASPG